MASTMPTMPDLQAVDFEALIEKHSDEDLNIDQHFTQDELREMSEYEKARLRNVKRNYLMLIELGVPAKMPDFMQEKRRSFTHHNMDTDSEDEWIPGAKAKPSKVKGQNKKAWEPPAKKIKRKLRDTPEVEEIKKEKQKKTQPEKEKMETKLAIESKYSHAAWMSKDLEECFAESDNDDMEFPGFTMTDIQESEKRSRERTEENAAIISQLESDSIDLEDEEEEEEEEGEENNEEVAICENESERVVDEPEQTGPSKKSRYPRRSVARVNYEEQRVPKDDDYIFCDDCDREHEGDCPIHGPLIAIEDTKVANDGSDADRAVHSLPKGLVVKASNIPGAGDGVWTEMDIAKGLRFGPYEGVEVTDSKAAHQSGYCWLIYHDGEIISHYVDAQYHRFANWLRFVNCARNELEQNLLAYQYQGNIFYKTIKPISKGTELLVWYGDEYAKELGITAEKSEVHALYRNAGFEVWECEVCGRIFPIRDWLLSHRRHHGDRSGSKKYKCEDCMYSTDIISHLSRHRRTHTSEKPFRCTVCDYRATQAGDLKRHMRTHTGEKPYTCTVCDYRTTVAGSLKTHMRRHTGEKLYRCTVCDYRTTWAGALKTHMRTHTGEKPYSCPLCNRRFISSSHCSQHIKTHRDE